MAMLVPGGFKRWTAIYHKKSTKCRYTIRGASGIGFFILLTNKMVAETVAAVFYKTISSEVINFQFEGDHERSEKRHWDRQSFPKVKLNRNSNQVLMKHVWMQERETGEISWGI